MGLGYDKNPVHCTSTRNTYHKSSRGVGKLQISPLFLDRPYFFSPWFTFIFLLTLPVLFVSCTWHHYSLRYRWSWVVFVLLDVVNFLGTVRLWVSHDFDAYPDRTFTWKKNENRFLAYGLFVVCFLFFVPSCFAWYDTSVSISTDGLRSFRGITLKKIIVSNQKTARDDRWEHFQGLE